MTACKQPLTGKQQLVYQYIENQLLGGTCPSVEEILRWTQPGRSMISGGSSMRCILKILKKKGWIKMSPSRHRSIQLTETDK